MYESITYYIYAKQFHYTEQNVLSKIAMLIFKNGDMHKYT